MLVIWQKRNKNINGELTLEHLNSVGVGPADYVELYYRDVRKTRDLNTDIRLNSLNHNQHHSRPTINHHIARVSHDGVSYIYRHRQNFGFSLIHRK